MLLKKLKLENIRSYKEGEIDFPEGSVLLSGDVGAGKSSILLAVEFALFGLLKGQLSGESLLRNGANQGSVMLHMELDGKDVIIRRGLKRSKQGIAQDAGYIILDGERSDATPTELKVKMLELLGYPQEMINKSKLIYRYTVYTPQEEMKQILDDEKDMRLDTLRKVFGVDKYKRIVENACALMKRMRSDRKHLLEKLSELPPKRKERAAKMDELEDIGKRQLGIEPKLVDMKQLIDNRKEDISKIEDKIAERQQIVKKLELEQLKLDHHVSQLEKNKKESSAIEEDIASTVDKISRITFNDSALPSEFFGKEEEMIEKELAIEETAIQSISRDEALVTQRLAHLNEMMSELNRKMEEMSEDGKALSDRKRLASDILAMISEKGDVEKRLEALDTELQQAIVDLKQSETLMDRSENIIKNIVAMNSCPTCMQEIPTAHKHKIRDAELENFNTHKDMISFLETKRKNAQSDKAAAKALLDGVHEKERLLEKVKMEISALERSHEELVEMRKRFSGLGMEQLKLETKRLDISNARVSERDALLEERKQLFRQLKENNFRIRERAYLESSLTEKRRRMESLRDEHERLKSAIRIVNTEKLKLNDALSEFDEIQKCYEAAKDDLDQLLLKERQLEIAVAELKKESEGVRKLLNLIDDAIVKLSSVESQLERLNLLHDWLESHFVRLMENMEKHVMLRAYGEFNDIFAKWFGILIEDETISVRLDDQFSPVVVQNGYETDVFNLSGGEKTSVALAYRLALNKVINDVIGDIKTKSIIILDEPTDGFSSYQLDKIKDVLEELDTKQVIMVSHESKIESFVQNVLRISKNEHVSRVLE